MLDLERPRELGASHKPWSVEDAAHAFPAAWRRNASDGWSRCGHNPAAVTCFSFYANDMITTGEGGMAATSDLRLAQRMRMMSRHGLSKNAWNRYNAGGSLDYQIIAPGLKYNVIDIDTAIVVHRLARAPSGSSANLSAYPEGPGEARRPASWRISRSNPAWCGIRLQPDCVRGSTVRPDPMVVPRSP